MDAAARRILEAMSDVVPEGYGVIILLTKPHPNGGYQVSSGGIGHDENQTIELLRKLLKGLEGDLS